MSQVLDLLLQVPLNSITEASMMKVIVAILTSSNTDLGLWMSTGRRIIDYAWASDRRFAVRLSGSLLALDWGGFKQFALIQIVNHAHISLRSEIEGERIAMLCLLSDLSKAGFLNETSDSWRKDLSEWASGELTGFQLSESSVSPCTNCPCHPSNGSE